MMLDEDGFEAALLDARTRRHLDGLDMQDAELQGSNDLSIRTIAIMDLAATIEVIGKEVVRQLASINDKVWGVGSET